MSFVPYLGMPRGWMRQIIGVSAHLSANPSDLGCIGSFWDNENKRNVMINLGFVALRFPSVFRAVASGSSERTFEGVEAAAQSADIPFFTDSDFDRFQVRVLCNTRTSDTTVSNHAS